MNAWIRHFRQPTAYVIVALAGSVLSQAVHADETKPTALVLECEGAVEFRLRPDRDWQELEVLQQLGEGGQVRTGSDGRVRLLLRSNTIAEVEPDQMYTVEPGSNEDQSIEPGLWDRLLSWLDGDTQQTAATRSDGPAVIQIAMPGHGLLLDACLLLTWEGGREDTPFNVRIETLSGASLWTSQTNRRELKLSAPQSPLDRGGRYRLTVSQPTPGIVGSSTTFEVLEPDQSARFLAKAAELERRAGMGDSATIVRSMYFAEQRLFVQAERELIDTPGIGDTIRDTFRNGVRKLAMRSAQGPVALRVTALEPDALDARLLDPFKRNKLESGTLLQVNISALERCNLWAAHVDHAGIMQPILTSDGFSPISLVSGQQKVLPGHDRRFMLHGNTGRELLVFVSGDRPIKEDRLRKRLLRYKNDLPTLRTQIETENMDVCIVVIDHIESSP